MNKSKVHIVDIETKTDFKTLRVIGVLTSDGNRFKFMDPTDFQEWLDGLPEGDIIFTWNGARFDFFVLEEEYGISLPTRLVHVDGMLLAKMLYPEAYRYSLDEFGRTFGAPEPKGEIDYDNAPLPELFEYLDTDLNITRHVAESLLNHDLVRKYPKAYLRACKLEGMVARLCEEQKRKGVRFDRELALSTLGHIEKDMELLEQSICMDLPPFPLTESELHYPPKVQFKKDGTPSAHITSYTKKYDWYLEKDGLGAWFATDGYGAVRHLPLDEPLVTTEKPTVAKTAKLKEYAMSLGWRPIFWNRKKTDKGWVKTSPRFNDKETGEIDPGLEALGIRWVDDYLEWMTLRHRKNIIKSDKGTGWLHESESTGTVAPDADTLGANTARWTHRGVANIPRVKSKLGKEIRSMFCAREGKYWVGWDASSLEAIVEAHYTYPYDEDYAKELISGDIHTKNMHAIAPIRDRDHSKTFKYGLTYGAQPPKVAAILGVPRDEGQYWYDKFWETSDALNKVRRDLDEQATRMGGWIQTIDGRFIKTRSPHSRLNALFQSTGAIIMKYAMLIANKKIKSEMPDSYGLIRYHDEEIWECDTQSQAERIAKIGVASIEAAAEYLNLNVPLTGEAKVGFNWADVH